MKWALTGRHAWLHARGELVHLGAALATQADVPPLDRLLRRVRGELEEWQQIEADGEDLRHLATAACARVAVADAALDHRLARLGDALIANGEPERYARFFPEPHEEVIALGLACELPAAMLAAERLAEAGSEDGGSELAETHLEPLRAAIQLGTVALSDRAHAYAELGRHQARLEAWLESHGAIVATTRATLARVAGERGLSERWVRAFFAGG